MPPNKGKPRRTPHAQPQPPPQPSDYETDAPQAMDYPAPPPAHSPEELNLRVIHRHYPEVTSIHYVAPYAVLYTFNLQTVAWEKVGVEGGLFICELVPSAAGVERYGVVILNRRSMENFYMEILGPDGIELQDDIIIMQSDQVYGLWVFCEENGSTATARADTWAKVEELTRRIEASKAAMKQNTDNGDDAAEQVPSSVPMGRQLSLRELFGQQRTQDAAWSVINHHNAQAAAPHQGHQPTQSSPSTQPDMLSQLFRKAKQDYNNVG